MGIARAQVQPRAVRTPAVVISFLLLLLVLSPLGALAAQPELAGSGAPGAAQEPDEHAAQAGEEHAEDEAHEAEPKPWFHWPAKWFNFVALCALLYWMLVVPPAPIQDIFSFPGLRVVLADRAAGIIAARDLAAQQAEEAVALVAESEQRLSKIEDEVAALVHAARDDAEREKVRALEAGRSQAAKVLELAEREVANERVAAHRQLRGFVADLAVTMAEKNLADHLTADDQDRLIRDYLARLGRSMA